MEYNDKTCHSSRLQLLLTLYFQFLQEKRDLQERLRVAQEMVKKLEEKVRELSRKSDEDKQRMLEKLREQNQADLKRMQKESQDALTRQLDEIKKQAEDAIHAKNKLTKENEQLADAVRKLHSRIKELEGQVSWGTSNLITH